MPASLRAQRRCADAEATAPQEIGLSLGRGLLDLVSPLRGTPSSVFCDAVEEVQQPARPRMQLIVPEQRPDIVRARSASTGTRTASSPAAPAAAPAKERGKTKRKSASGVPAPAAGAAPRHPTSKTPQAHAAKPRRATVTAGKR